MRYSLGAKVGLLTMAMDERVNALAAVSGFDPLRRDTSDRGVEGIRHYSHLHGLMPRLGFFVGHETLDVPAAVRRVPGVTLETPEDFNRFGRKLQARVLDWLAKTNH